MPHGADHHGNASDGQDVAANGRMEPCKFYKDCGDGDRGEDCGGKSRVAHEHFEKHCQDVRQIDTVNFRP